MVPSESAIAARELQRHEWLASAEQERLADLACAGGRCPEPHAALATAIAAIVHRLTVPMARGLRARPAVTPASTAVDSP
ncbi:MAG: hypothetical protein U0Z70_23220 [Thermomicrobiales bacterium]